jgi:hypothetical protein
MASQRRQLAWRTRFTAFVALVLLAVLAGYFYFGYRNFDDVTRPELVVQAAETFIDMNLPELRKSLQAEIIRSAPGWAEQLSEQLQTSMPQAREQLENHVVQQMDGILHEANAMSQDQFRTFLQQNRPVLERGFQDLASSPKLAEKTMDEVIDALDQQLSLQMKRESSELFDTVVQMKQKLDLLKNAQNLTNEQQIERRVLMLTRRLQLETVEPGSAPALAGGPSQPGGAATGEAAAPPAEETAGEAPAPAEEAKPEGKGDEKDAPSAAPSKDDKPADQTAE